VKRGVGVNPRIESQRAIQRAAHSLGEQAKRSLSVCHWICDISGVWTFSALGCKCRARSVAVTAHEVVVDHPGCLHEGIDNRRPHEFKTALDEIFKIAVERGVSMGICADVRKLFTLGTPPR
jgi:hypothetical protein